MSKLFKRKKPYNLRSSKQLKTSTPRAKVDACVECDLPFDENTIAPELRRVQPHTKKDSATAQETANSPETDVNSGNKTTLEPVDISVEPSEQSVFTHSFHEAQVTREEVRIGLEVQDISEPEELRKEKQLKTETEKKGRKHYRGHSYDRWPTSTCNCNT